MTAGDEAGPGGSYGERGPGKAAGCDAGIGADGPVVTIIVDGANVVGSRPDGWWRDRAGAAVRLHDELAKLAARGATGIPAELLATAGGEQPAVPPGPDGDPSGLVKVRVILVLEGAARAAGPRIAERARRAEGGRVRAADAGTVQVVSAPGSGDDEIVRQARSCAGCCIVVTADRELRRRCLAAGARVAGPSWLYALL
jgi:8-oxo-dGTP diphosphatase